MSWGISVSCVCTGTVPIGWLQGGWWCGGGYGKIKGANVACPHIHTQTHHVSFVCVDTKREHPPSKRFWSCPPEMWVSCTHTHTHIILFRIRERVLFLNKVRRFSKPLHCIYAVCVGAQQVHSWVFGSSIMTDQQICKYIKMSLVNKTRFCSVMSPW